MQLKGFETLWGEDYSDIDLSAGDRTPTHDSILNIDEVSSVLKDGRNGSNNKKSLSVQVVYDTNESSLEIICDNTVLNLSILNSIEEYEINTFVVQNKKIDYRVIILQKAFNELDFSLTHVMKNQQKTT